MYVCMYVHRCTVQFFKKGELDLLALTKKGRERGNKLARQIVLARGKF